MISHWSGVEITQTNKNLYYEKAYVNQATVHVLYAPFWRDLHLDTCKEQGELQTRSLAERGQTRVSMIITISIHIS